METKLYRIINDGTKVFLGIHFRQKVDEELIRHAAIQLIGPLKGSFRVQVKTDAGWENTEYVITRD